MKALFCAIFFLVTTVALSARTINVPADEATIQAGLMEASWGDTVLVQPGTYTENICFPGVGVVLGSLFLTTADSSYISQTIIDGNASGSVVTFQFYEDNTAVLTGFVIQNGLSVQGGGIYCNNSSPTITNNRIVANRFDARESIGYGAGIYCLESQARITNNEIRDNSYLGDNHSGAGGIYLENSDPLIEDNLIADNSSQNVGGGMAILNSSGLIRGNTITGNYSRYGGAISCGVASTPTITSNIMFGNSAVTGDGIDIFEGSTPVIVNNIIAYNDGLGIFWDDSDPVITNTIIWGNEIFGRGEEIITYCDIQGGWEGIGNIDTDPLFRDPDNNDFHLMASVCGDPYDSPCIDAGHPDSVDGLLSCQWGQGSTRADMGAYGGIAGSSTGVNDIDNGLGIPENFVLSQNYPNPFNPSTTIQYSLPRRTEVSISIYNLLGQRVRVFDEGIKTAGTHSVIWNGCNSLGRPVASGVYLYQIRAGDFVDSRRMLLIK